MFVVVALRIWIRNGWIGRRLRGLWVRMVDCCCVIKPWGLRVMRWVLISVRFACSRFLGRLIRTPRGFFSIIILWLWMSIWIQSVCIGYCRSRVRCLGVRLKCQWITISVGFFRFMCLIWITIIICCSISITSLLLLKTWLSRWGLGTRRLWVIILERPLVG